MPKSPQQMVPGFSHGTLCTWPDAHLILQDVIEPSPEYAIPFAHGKETGKGSAKTWLAHHPESVAEMIGNLTALIWYRIAS